MHQASPPEVIDPMNAEPAFLQARPAASVLATNKLIRNTYVLLSFTLLFSALTASISVALRVSPGVSLLCFGGAILMLFFVLPRFANSMHGLWLTFAITGLFGFGLGPSLMHYLAAPNGPQVVVTALAGTGVIFLALSGYALTTRKDFSFMGGFLVTGLLVVFGAILVNLFVAIPALSLAIAAIGMLIFSGFILYDTSRMVHGGETNYIHATIGLYVSILNIFQFLLMFLGMSSDD